MSPVRSQWSSWRYVIPTILQTCGPRYPCAPVSPDMSSPPVSRLPPAHQCDPDNSVVITRASLGYGDKGQQSTSIARWDLRFRSCEQLAITKAQVNLDLRFNR